MLFLLGAILAAGSDPRTPCVVWGVAALEHALFSSALRSSRASGVRSQRLPEAQLLAEIWAVLS